MAHGKDMRLRPPSAAGLSALGVSRRAREGAQGRSLGNSLHWGLSPGPSVYKTDALPLSYRGTGEPDAQHPFIVQNLPASGCGQD